MTTIRRIPTSKIDGNDSNSTDANEIRPYGEIAVYGGDNNKLELLMFDGVRTHVKSKVLNKGTFYGGDADSGDGEGLDTIKLVPDEELRRNGSDQYLTIDPTGGEPNHIHIRAGGTIDQSSTDLFLGGEKNNVRVSDINDRVTITTDAGEGTRTWTFNNSGELSLPNSGVIESSDYGGFSLRSRYDTPINNVIGSNIYVSPGQVSINYQVEFEGVPTPGYQWNFNSVTQALDLADGGLKFANATVQTTDSLSASGTLITVSLNAAGDTIDYVGGASVLEIPKNSDTNQIQAGWIITFTNGGAQRTVAGVVDGGEYWAVTYDGANPALAELTYPVTVQSADYAAETVGKMTITIDDIVGTKSYEFGANGVLTFPNQSGKINPSVSDGGGLQIEAELDFEIKVTQFEGDPTIWSFAGEDITFPDGSIQSTAWTGNVNWDNVTNTPTIPADVSDLTDTQGLLVGGSANTGAITFDDNEIQANPLDTVGTQITVNSNYINVTSQNSNVFNLTKSADTDQVLVGWIIRGDGGGPQTITNKIDNGSYWSFFVAMGIQTEYPITIESADYQVGSDPQLILTVAPDGVAATSWTFDDNGSITFPDATVQTTAYVPTDLTGYALTADIPDVSNFITAEDIPAVDLTGYATETYVTTAIGDIVIPTVPTNVSEFTNDAGFITSSSLTGLATETYVTTAIADIPPTDLTGYATETYVNTQVSNLVNAAPSTLDTLNELAAALGDDPNFATTVSTAIGLKANTADLATVATSGSYDDLTNKPNIPADVSDLTDTEGLLLDPLNLTATAAAATVTSTAASVGYMGIPQNERTGDYTLVMSDAGKHLLMKSSGAITIPSNSSVPFPIGTTIDILSYGGTTTTIATTSPEFLAVVGVGFPAGTRTLGGYGWAKLIKIESGAWFIHGEGLS